MKRKAALVLIGLLWTTPASAGVNAFKSVQIDSSAGGVDLDGFVVNQISIDFSGQWTVAQAYVLPSDAESIYQHANGGTSPPNAALVEGIPALAFDTFVAVGSPNSDGPWGDPVIDPGNCFICAEPAVWDASKLNVVWGPAGDRTVSDHSGFLIMQLTLGNDVNGTAMFFASADGSLSRAQAVISQGVLSFVPEPASGLLFGLALVIAAARVRVARRASRSANQSSLDDQP
jgi:hypothetical protein